MHVDCQRCGHKNAFDQPHPYHAGFANVGFLYNDQGNRTLIWSSFDPTYEAIVGKVHPWALSLAQRTILESALLPASNDGSWRFENPPRCMKCAAPIGKPITGDITYLLYPGSSDLSNIQGGLHAMLTNFAA